MSDPREVPQITQLVYACGKCGFHLIVPSDLEQYTALMTHRGCGGIFSHDLGLPQYRCHKEVRAAKIVDIVPAMELPASRDFNTCRLYLEKGLTPVVSPEWMGKHKPEIGGYYVVYADGYTSYSPAKAFEEGYTRIGLPVQVDWIGPEPTYLPDDDVYICDPRDGDKVRELINSGVLPLKNPRKV